MAKRRDASDDRTKDAGTTADGEPRKKKKKRKAAAADATPKPERKAKSAAESKSKSKSKTKSKSKSKASTKGKKQRPTHGSADVHYGVLRGRIVKGKREAGKSTPHYQIQVRAERDGEASAAWRVPVNVRSADGSEVLFAADPDVTRQSADRGPLVATWTAKLDALAALPAGWTALGDHVAGVALDYVREAYVEKGEMTQLPSDGPGANDDVQDEVELFVKRAIAQKADVYVFGSRFDDSSESGVHDIHMNQGNGGKWERDNGVYQDGGLVLRFPSGKTAALLFAFDTQSWDTDDRGNPR